MAFRDVFGLRRLRHKVALSDSRQEAAGAKAKSSDVLRSSVAFRRQKRSSLSTSSSEATHQTSVIDAYDGSSLTLGLCAEKVNT
jgi:hypothetical protein